jgi:hypothetical protein
LQSRLTVKNANCVRPSNVSRSLTSISSIAADGRSVEHARTPSTTPTRGATAMDRRGSCTTVTSRGCSHANDGCAPSRTRGSTASATGACRRAVQVGKMSQVFLGGPFASNPDVQHVGRHRLDELFGPYRRAAQPFQNRRK